MTIPVTRPDPAKLGELIGALVGRETNTKLSDGKYESGRPYAVGYYRADDGEIAAIASCDLEFACYAGAALSMIPLGRAKEALEEGQIDENLRENTQEVLNVCAQALQNDQANIRLREVTVDTAPFAGDASRFIESAGQQMSVDVDVEGYGSGSMLFHFS